MLLLAALSFGCYSQCFQLKEVIYIGRSRFGTTCHVLYRGDFDIEGVRFTGVSLYITFFMNNSLYNIYTIIYLSPQKAQKGIFHI